MRQRRVGYRLDFDHLQQSKVGLPLLEPIQRIVIRAEILRQPLPLNRSPEHRAQQHEELLAGANLSESDLEAEKAEANYVRANEDCW